MRANNITDRGLTFDDLVFVRAGNIAPKQRIVRGDIVIAASSGSLSVVGKAAQATADFDGSFGAFCKVVRPGPLVDANYLGHFFRTSTYRRHISSLAAGANINNLRSEHLDDLAIPLPALSEQQRIAAILDQADALRRLRRDSLDRLADLGQAIFYEMFGDVRSNDRGWPEGACLNDFAEVVSGITKGRKTNGEPTRDVPYMTVATVQDGYLKLDNVKSIQATEREIKRYRLVQNDILLTEGGDPDKLGRGTMWNDELPECIHQNHVFRVRVIDDHITPTFATWLIGSNRGKAYFLRAAKQTTGIASINSSQLKVFPLVLPPIALQNMFGERIGLLNTRRKVAKQAYMQTEALFASLQHRAFRGEL